MQEKHHSSHSYEKEKRYRLVPHPPAISEHRAEDSNAIWDVSGHSEWWLEDMQRWAPFPWWSGQWVVAVRASSGNRWHGQTGHFYDILTKGLFAKGCPECRKTTTHSTVSSLHQWGTITPQRTKEQEEGVVIRTRRSQITNRSSGLWPRGTDNLQ